MDRSIETQIPGHQLPRGVASAGPLGHIRPLDCRDVEAVRRIAAESFPMVWSEQDFNYFLSHENRLCLGLFSEGGEESRLRAYFLGLVVHGDLDIISVATCEFDRRLGFGQKLLDLACRQTSVLRAFLEVETDNEGAIGLYKKWGFQLLGRRSAYYGPGRDAYLMRWEKRTAEVFPKPK